MKKTYIIRKVAFHYSDDHYYFHMFGAIEGDTLYDWEKAYQTLMHLEKMAYLEIDLTDYGNFWLGDLDNRTQNARQLEHYLEHEIGLQLSETKSWGWKSIPRGTYLPKSITDEQIEKIRYLSGLKFYDLVTFNHEPQFYGIWQQKPFYDHAGFRQEYNSVFFYNTYAEAFDAGIETVIWQVHEKTIKGKLNELSEMPLILKAVIDNSNNIKYDDVKHLLSIGYANLAEWKALYTLLKHKPFEIRLLDWDTVKKAEHDGFEAM